jgi:hypothetical protein
MNVLLCLFHGIGKKNSQFVAIVLWYLVCGHIIMYNEHQSSKNTFLDATIDGIARSVRVLLAIQWQLTNSSRGVPLR